ncbi:MAG: hypothetical protein ABFS41_08120 [Myxococcota bacterium]
MNTVSRLLRRRGALCALALAGTLTMAPVSASAVDAKEAGLGAACALTNLVYGPVKLIYAAFGGLTAGIGYALTAGDVDVARVILDTSVNGDYVIEPAHLRGEKTLAFVGAPDNTLPPEDDWSTADNSGF